MLAHATVIYAGANRLHHKINFLISHTSVELRYQTRSSNSKPEKKRNVICMKSSAVPLYQRWIYLWRAPIYWERFSSNTALEIMGPLCKHSVTTEGLSE